MSEGGLRQPEVVDVTTREGREEYGREAELKYLRKENKKLQESVHDQETLFDRIVSAAHRPRSTPNFTYSPSDGAKRRDVILHLSDLHYGEHVKAEETPGGVNIFNAEVFEERLKRYVDATCGILQDSAAGHTMENLIFACGGDFVTGDNIFPFQAWTLDRHPIEQVLELTELLVNAAHEIMRVGFEEVGMRGAYFFCVTGNHGRMQGGKKSGGQPPTYSWDWLIYKMLEKQLSNYPVTTFAIEPAGSLYFGSKDHIFHLAHGDTLKGALSIPFYGVGRFDQRSIRSHQIVPDAILLGHFHVRGDVPLGHGESLHSGSFMGPNNLSKFVGASPASQTVYLVSEEYGAAQRNVVYLQSRTERQLKPTVYSVG